MTLHDTLPPSRSPWRVCLMLCVMMLSAIPSAARASVLADRLEFGMYGRMGLAWTPTSGRFIQGKSMNLTGTSEGGRLEEGDYLEPTLKVHLLERNTDAAAPYVDLVLTPSIYSAQGLLAGIFSTGFTDPTVVSLFQAYMESGNVAIPGLRVWAGQRFYRGTDVHIADVFYFNNLSGQGGGVAYGPLDLAIIMQTSLNKGQYNADVDGDGKLDIRRQRTVFIAQGVKKFDSGHSLHGLAEFHLLPAATVTVPDGSQQGFNADYGWVLGVKAHFDLGNDGFNDIAIRYGSRAASGSRAGAQTWDSFGNPNAEGRYDDAAGIQAVEHFLYNFGPRFSLNAYGILHYNSGLGAVTTTGTQPKDSNLEYSIGARGAIYLHENFHLLEEASYQGVKREGSDLATAVKLSIIPTFVPLGGRSLWSRPHFRVFYTLALYNKVAVDGLYSPYLQTVGKTPVGHYIGSRVEWWF